MARRALLATFLSLLVAVVVSAQSSPAEVMTNAAVAKLVKAGFSDKTIIAIINVRPSRFDLAPDRLIELKKRGVSERLILAMLARQEAVARFDADLDDDTFFSGGSPGGADRAQPGETNIFGSSGGVRGRTRTRGADGAAEGDTETVGSASARIVRPTSEAGAQSALRLEKTPTLTNESIIQLVDAGFSEGTIIRRIEQSPVEFDLSESKLAELRRRRVGAPIIAAMKTAMSDEPASVRPQ